MTESKIKLEIFNWAKEKESVNSVTRQLQDSCQNLYRFDRSEIGIRNDIFKSQESFNCYSCSRSITYSHPVYVYVCMKCGNRFQKYRHLDADLSGRVILVIGARTKLGHQIVVKLLDAGATVIGTTRYPNKALNLYQDYTEKWETWSKRLHFFPDSFDLDTNNLDSLFSSLSSFITDTLNIPLTDMVFNAAQTIRCREKNTYKINENDEKNRYGDSKFVPENMENSWNLKIEEISQQELEEVHRINAIAPFLLVKHMMPLLQKNEQFIPNIIHVHAKEGVFDTNKGNIHIHTNMAKASLHMFTKCLHDCKYKTLAGKNISIYGIDPGWISVDEYYKNNKPWIVPPLDEVDGAARILFPLFWKNIHGSGKTRRHFKTFTY